MQRTAINAAKQSCYHLQTNRSEPTLVIDYVLNQQFSNFPHRRCKARAYLCHQIIMSSGRCTLSPFNPFTFKCHHFFTKIIFFLFLKLFFFLITLLDFLFTNWWFGWGFCTAFWWWKRYNNFVKLSVTEFLKKLKTNWKIVEFKFCKKWRVNKKFKTIFYLPKSDSYFQIRFWSV